MTTYILIVMISTMYNISIHFQEFDSQASCESAAAHIRTTIKSEEIICQKK